MSVVLLPVQCPSFGQSVFPSFCLPSTTYVLAALPHQALSFAPCRLFHQPCKIASCRSAQPLPLLLMLMLLQLIRAEAVGSSLIRTASLGILGPCTTTVRPTHV